MLSPLQISILQNLVIFKQLTIPQFAKLNVGSSEQSIRRALQKIYKKRKPLVKCVEFKKVSHFGKLSYVYSLSLYGLRCLEAQRKSKVAINTFTPATPRLTDDYFHRVTTIDFHIYMNAHTLSEDYEVVMCDQYFVVKKIMNSLNSINKINLGGGTSIIPDSIACLKNGDSERWIMFELHNGLEKSRIKEQLKQHAICLTGLFAHNKYNIAKHRYYNILIIFEEPGVMNAVIKDISNEKWYSNVAEFFLCKSKDDMKETFLNGWTTLSGKEAKIEF